jgi:hypothetical protein
MKPRTGRFGNLGAEMKKRIEVIFGDMNSEKEAKKLCREMLLQAVNEACDFANNIQCPDEYWALVIGSLRGYLSRLEDHLEDFDKD